MHRYIAELRDTEYNNISFSLISANNLKEAKEILYNFNRKTINRYNIYSLKLYNGQKSLLKHVNVFISKKWIKFRNE